MKRMNPSCDFLSYYRNKAAIFSSKAATYRNKAATLLLSAVFLAGLTACSDLNTDSTQGKGTINYHITNTPSGSGAPSASLAAPDEGALELSNIDLLQEINIEVLEVVVGYSDVLTDTVSADSVVIGEGHRQWLTVTESPFTLNLLEITNVDMLFSEAELPEGYYSEIRLILGDGNEVVDENGVAHALRVPSGQQSGYKIKFDSRLHSGETFDLTINFDAQRSVHRTGNGRYMLQPVLQANRGRINPD